MPTILDLLNGKTLTNLKAYGTAEGVEKAWDSRGRGKSSAKDKIEKWMEKQQLLPKNGKAGTIFDSMPGSFTQKMKDTLEKMGQAVEKTRPSYTGLEAYGTPEGVEKAWDTRGRGKSPVNKEAHDFLMKRGFDHVGNHTHGFGATVSVYDHPKTNSRLYVSKLHTIQELRKLIGGFAKRVSKVQERMP